MSMAIKRKNGSAGFTLIELLIAITLSSMIVTVFVSTLLSMVRTATLQRTQLELSQKAQIALDTIERDIRVSRAYDTTLGYSTFSDSYGPTNTDDNWTGTWSYKGSDASDPDHRVLLLRQNATTTNPMRASRTPVFIQGYLDNPYAERDVNLNCTAYNASTAPTGALAYNPQLPYYLIYFVRDNNLYRRTVTDTTTPLCSSGQYQKQSCPKADTTPHANCRASDELIVADVSSFSVAYTTILYDSNGRATVTDIDAYSKTSSTIFEEVSNVVVTLKLKKNLSGTSRETTVLLRTGRAN